VNQYSVDDTIVGIASANGAAVRGVLRLSGPSVVDCLKAHFELDPTIKLSCLQAARVVEAVLPLPPPLQSIPGDLYVWPTRRSYTRQPSAEFHTVGSPPVLQAAVRALCQGEVRLAEPGEFTMRAFLAGRLDLTQAEAVLGVIDAHDSVQLEVALQQLAGGLTSPLDHLRTRLLELLAQLEAGLDFVEEDIEFISAERLQQELEDVLYHVIELTTQLARRSLATDVPRVVFVGLPNVGKSSLFNVLTGDAAALVSSDVGTTRDYLTRRVDLEGLQVDFVDTAGLEETTDAETLEKSAQAVAREQHRSAALQLICIDATCAPDMQERLRSLMSSGIDQCVVYTKCDRAQLAQLGLSSLQTSAHGGQGIAELRLEIRDRLAAQLGSYLAVPATSVRCHQSLEKASNCLRSAAQLVREDMGEEVVAMEIRQALDELGRIVGAVYTDDLLDRIFSRFCIGK
jgi:tRNA modification GTPase